MQRKVFAAVDLEFEMEDPGHDVATSEIRGILEEALRRGLLGQPAGQAVATSVNFVGVTDWNP